MQTPDPQYAAMLTLTSAAVMRIHELITEEGNNKLKLRVYITGGGCSGFQYGFAFDEQIRPDDHVIEKMVPREEAFLEEEEEEEEEGGGEEGGFGTPKVSVVIDALSIMYLTGAEIDYIESLQGAHFTVKNPNAQTTCSCGSSFSL